MAVAAPQRTRGPRPGPAPGLRPRDAELRGCSSPGLGLDRRPVVGSLELGLGLGLGLRLGLS